ncbi:hypothetical protein Aab01nite_39190 [Paractinoplanes abujensis]|uniref:tyrosine-type recombinase/integrase n=1 Tax=Paractinoplanes abujensis TaxID=882441 RepID=UPI001A48038B|nr:tyrosine-type recombinase/integrase [Actinoplanes abujensis]GID20329.1 hypothetical protein Aab01nite_39190 [Actinoplanes abujensis]
MRNRTEPRWAGGLALSFNSATAPGPVLPSRWGIHGLRHYYATLLIHAGASVKTVQLTLGHSTPTLTLNECVHEWPDALDRNRALVNGAPGERETAATSAVSRA